jgi:ABC-2 type transport system permease protein
MNVAFVIAARSLRQRIRDRSAILSAVVVPFGLAAAFALLIPGGSSFHAVYRVFNADHGPVATALVDGALQSLVEEGVAEVTSVDTEAAALAAVSDGTTSAVVLIPAGFSAAVEAGRPTTVRIVATPDALLGARIVGSVVSSFASQVGAIQLAVVTSSAWRPGEPIPSLDPGTVAAVRQVPSPIGVTDTNLERRQANSATFYAAAMAIMFLFFTTVYGPLGLLGERRTGTLARLLAAPIRQASMVLGAAITASVLGIVSMTVLVVATGVLLGATWGPPLLVAPLVLAAVVAAVGLSMLVCTLARTEAQAGTWNSMLGITMAVLGGAMVPLSQGPELLHRLSLITPHAWFLDAINQMSGQSVSFADVAPAIGVLLAFGLVTGALGLTRARNFLVAR